MPRGFMIWCEHYLLFLTLFTFQRSLTLSLVSQFPNLTPRVSIANPPPFRLGTDSSTQHQIYFTSFFLHLRSVQSQIFSSISSVSICDYDLFFPCIALQVACKGIPKLWLCWRIKWGLFSVGTWISTRVNLMWRGSSEDTGKSIESTWNLVYHSLFSFFFS